MKAISIVNKWICVSLGFFLFLIQPVYADDHGNSFSTATQVSIGSITQGSIETPGDLDYFKFTIAQPGKYVFYTRGTTDITGTLYDSTYSYLTMNYDDGEADNFRIVYNFIYTGTYYIEVRHNSTSAIGSYTLHIEGPGAGTVSDDHGFSPWSATAVNIGSITSGNINLPGDLDYFKFTIAQPGKYVFYTRGTTDITGTLYDSTYSYLTMNYDDGEADNFRIVYNFIYTGTYYIEVRHNSTSAIGSYTLHIEGPGAGTVSDDHGFSPWSATAVNIGSITSGNINLPGDLDYFKFTIAQPGKYVFYTRGTTDTTGTLYDSTYSYLTMNYDDGEADNFRIVHNFIYTGTYYIEVRHNSTSAIGSYTLHIEGPGAGTVSDDHGFSPWSATNIYNAGSYLGVINLPGDLDYFRIYVPQTTMVTCYTTVNIVSVDTTGKLFDANYNLIATDYNSGEYDNFRIQRQLSPGVYFIEVSHNSSSGIGDYILHIEGLPLTCAYTLSSYAAEFAAASALGTVNVTTSSSSCSWTAVSNVPWITVTSGSSGIGNGTVSYQIAINNTGHQRNGTITIAGKIFTVTQKKMVGLPWLLLLLGN